MWMRRFYNVFAISHRATLVARQIKNLHYLSYSMYEVHCRLLIVSISSMFSHPHNFKVAYVVWSGVNVCKEKHSLWRNFYWGYVCSIDSKTDYVHTINTYSIHFVLFIFVVRLSLIDVALCYWRQDL